MLLFLIKTTNVVILTLLVGVDMNTPFPAMAVVIDD